MNRPARPPASRSTVDWSQDQDLLETALKALVVALVVARMLVPSESSISGATLWITQLWLATPVLWSWICFRRGAGRLQIDGLDLALWLIVIGHLVSGLVVYQRGGQVRLALNMVWEWIGLGCSVFMIRQLMCRDRDRNQFLYLVLLVGVVCAGLGLWQHYVWYPEIKRSYTQQRVALDRLERAQAQAVQPSLDRSWQISQLRDALTQQGIPLQGPQRELWENRIRNSTEPFGPHALANTLAGLLVFWGLLWIGQILAAEDRGGAGGWGRRVMLFAVSLAFVTCLALTKGRTAWVGGLVAAVAWWVWQRRGLRGRGTSPARPRWMLPAGVLTLLVVGGVWLVSLDREVLSEAPKSLKYRLYYWSGTLSMLADHPAAGSGPGNFRQHYLRHKLPESSEEISDPHNLFLGIWTSGGLISLCGLLLWMGLVAHRVRAAGRGTAPPRDPDAQPETVAANGPGTPASPGPSWTLIWGAIAGFSMVLASQWIVGQDTEWTLSMLVGFVVLVAAVRRCRVDNGVSLACAAAALLAMGVHLLGAGGIEMPAVVQMPLLLSILAIPAAARVWQSNAVHVSLGVLGLLAFVGCLFTATLPVLSREAQLSLGDAEAARGNVAAARTHYKAAAEADRFAPECWTRLAALALPDGNTGTETAAAQFDQALQLAREAIRRDRFGYVGHLRLSRFYQSRYRQTGDAEDARGAQLALQAAVDRYPQNAALVGELARQQAVAGAASQARTTASKALELDSINQRQRHSDKRLPSEVIRELKQLVGKPSDSETAAEVSEEN